MILVITAKHSDSTKACFTVCGVCTAHINLDSTFYANPFIMYI